MTLSPYEAYQTLMRFARERGEGPLKLAMHAAVPQSFRPRLLHLMKLNFIAEFAGDGWVESDVLQAAFCSEMGGGYYQFDGQVRALLLDNLQSEYDDGPARLRAVASFLLAYLDEQERAIDTQDRLGTSYIEVQRWVALSILDPDATAQQLAAALHAAAAPGTVAARMQIGGLVKVLAAPLLRYPRLADYASGMAALEQGDVERARHLLDGLGPAEVQVGAVRLRSGRAVLEEWKVPEVSSAAGQEASRYLSCVLVFVLGEQSKDFVPRLFQDLRQAGVDCTTIPSGESGGYRDVIRERQAVIVIGSRDRSEFSQRAGEAVDYARSLGRKLVSASLDRSWGILFPNTVTMDEQVDFQNWQDQYDTPFSQLLEALRPGEDRQPESVTAKGFEYDVLIVRAEMDDQWAAQLQQDLGREVSRHLGREVRIGRVNVNGRDMPAATTLVVIFSQYVAVDQCEKAVARFLEGSENARSRLFLTTTRKLEPLLTPEPFRKRTYTDFCSVKPDGKPEVLPWNSPQYAQLLSQLADAIARELRPLASDQPETAETRLDFVGRSLALSIEGMSAAMEALGVPAAVVWAILHVETRGVGFLPDRRPLILFERHIFRQLTQGKFDEAGPNVSSARPGGYQVGAQEYTRLMQAISLDRSAALQSSSWGLTQVLGRNFAAAGFPNVETMVSAMMNSEDTHLDALVRFLQSQRLERHLQSRDWAAFARSYNGPNYARGRVDDPLAQAVEKYSKGPLPDLNVRAAQLYLTFLGLDPGAIDGILGAKTRSAIRSFQASRKLPVSGDADLATLTALTPGASSAAKPAERPGTAKTQRPSPCQPISVEVAVLTPDDKSKLIFGLARLCEPKLVWMILFTLQEIRGGEFTDRVKLEVAVGEDQIPNAEMLANAGLSRNQADMLMRIAARARELEPGTTRDPQLEKMLLRLL